MTDIPTLICDAASGNCGGTIGIGNCFDPYWGASPGLTSSNLNDYIHNFTDVSSLSTANQSCQIQAPYQCVGSGNANTGCYNIWASNIGPTGTIQTTLNVTGNVLEPVNVFLELGLWYNPNVGLTVPTVTNGVPSCSGSTRFHKSLCR